MTKFEVIKLRAVIEKAVQSLDDKTALTAVRLFPAWEADKTYVVDAKVQFGGMLYKCRQEHTSQADWAPDVSPALFAVINETNAGSLEDPIPAAAGMLYEKDKYYIYNDVVYLCIREDAEGGTVLHFTPDALVGHYFEVVK